MGFWRRTYGLDLLTPGEREAVLVGEAVCAVAGPSPEQLHGICAAAWQRTRMLGAPVTCTRLGFRLLSAAHALLEDAARCLFEHIHGSTRHPPGFAAGSPTMQLIITDVGGRDVEAEPEAARRLVSDVLRPEFPASLTFAQHPGWDTAGAMVVLPEHRGSEQDDPKHADRTTTQGAFAYDVPFLRHGQADGRDGNGARVPPGLFVEIRFLPMLL